MKAQIPKGFRRLRRNEILREGDKFSVVGKWYFSKNAGRKVSNCACLTYIRRIPRSKPVQSRKKAPAQSLDEALRKLEPKNRPEGYHQ